MQVHLERKKEERERGERETHPQRPMQDSTQGEEQLQPFPPYLVSLSFSGQQTEWKSPAYTALFIPT